MIEREATWQDHVIAFLKHVEQIEESAQESNAAACPFCGTDQRDEDDGAWDHDGDCLVVWARDLLMARPQESNA